MASLVEPNDFIYYSTLTVIYRAQTFSNKTMEVNSKCYEAAKLSLTTHLRCHEKLCSQHMDKRLDYVNWFLLYPAFTPFIVVFIHTTSAYHPLPSSTASSTTSTVTSPSTTTASSSDLALLHAVVRSLSDLRTLSPGATRLHDICAALLAVADILSEAHNLPKAENASEPARLEHGGVSADLGSTSTSSGKFAMTWPQSQSQVQGQDGQDGLRTGGSGSGSGFEGINAGDMSMGDMGDLGDLSDLDKLFGTWFGANRPMTDIFNAGFDFEDGGDMF